jgi:hypothetical protein
MLALRIGINRLDTVAFALKELFGTVREEGPNVPLRKSPARGAELSRAPPNRTIASTPSTSIFINASGATSPASIIASMLRTFTLTRSAEVTPAWNVLASSLGHACLGHDHQVYLGSRTPTAQGCSAMERP